MKSPLLLMLFVPIIQARPPAFGISYNGILTGRSSVRFPANTSSSSSTCIGITNVPRSGSTWLLTVLQQLGPIYATHWPFFNQTRLLNINVWERCTILLLTRNPQQVYPSYQKLFKHKRFDSYETFLQRYYRHNTWWKQFENVIEIRYEDLARQRLPFYKELEDAYMRNAHIQW